MGNSSKPARERYLLQILAESKECLPHSSDNAKTCSKTFPSILIIYESLNDGNDFKTMLVCSDQREGRHSMDAACQYEDKITANIEGRK